MGSDFLEQAKYFAGARCTAKPGHTMREGRFVPVWEAKVGKHFIRIDDQSNWPTKDEALAAARKFKAQCVDALNQAAE